ncbi:pyridoxal phosphate homeostasis protein-like [Juglans microcarpa x Juglans regia]|uniref:pyridoxal phosphate homeostasis protein-like n=1 Tax=Juglans microcarpa x Juglans regia TaxID=2249226 RepID=UPI001B7EDC1D|nr:pyridoxal phosphate homeostasis protein-like [Juglans microcarpa x Juglans regia]
MATFVAATEGVIIAFRSVLRRAHLATERFNCGFDRVQVVAMSKTKQVFLIRQVYDARHQCLGENYVQELINKASQLPDVIEWHFIGNLQSNNTKPLLGYLRGLDRCVKPSSSSSTSSTSIALENANSKIKELIARQYELEAQLAKQADIEMRIKQ